MTNKNKRKKQIYNVLLVVLLLALLVVGTFIGIKVYDNLTTQQRYAEVAEQAEIVGGEEKSGHKPMKVNFDKLRKINKDVVGYIKISKTKVNYPVVQCKDNTTYLYRTFYGNNSAHGSIFMDYRNRIEESSTNRNIILYGHNMLDGSMFGDLKKYKSKDYCKKNPLIYFNTIHSADVWEVFSAFTVPGTETNLYKPDFPDDKEYHRWFSWYMNEYRTFYTLKKSYDIDNELLTLSTCESSFNNERFVVIARKVTGE